MDPCGSHFSVPGGCIASLQANFGFMSGRQSGVVAWNTGKAAAHDMPDLFLCFCCRGRQFRRSSWLCRADRSSYGAADHRRQYAEGSREFGALRGFYRHVGRCLGTYSLCPNGDPGWHCDGGHRCAFLPDPSVSEARSCLK